ncbi:hypothetical protein KR51_00032890 [Rubidibacter lacunae KORDI 51-2]|uniref:Uncharacterized protein n=1 Tax=Rubidibacter lacunae KORDI 51-2 TaxID=582515 RepID=U5DKT8_9CHRO|nr:hypothetical protein KR51_00032890 [Rubidibacter lacunae KORDI 51-2]
MLRSAKNKELLKQPLLGSARAERMLVRRPVLVNGLVVDSVVKAIAAFNVDIGRRRHDKFADTCFQALALAIG